MAEHRPLVLLNGHLQQLPAGDDLSTHLVLVVNAGELEQYPAASDLSLVKPLVFAGGEVIQLPTGDTIAGIVAAANNLVDHSGTYAIFGASVSTIQVRNTRPFLIHGSFLNGVSSGFISTNVIHGTNNNGLSGMTIQTFVILE